jgi:hypothetical protein
MTTIDKEAQQFGPFTPLSSYKLFSTIVNNTNILNCSRKVLDIFVWL